MSWFCLVLFLCRVFLRSIVILFFYHLFVPINGIGSWFNYGQLRAITLLALCFFWLSQTEKDSLRSQKAEGEKSKLPNAVISVISVKKYQNSLPFYNTIIAKSQQGITRFKLDVSMSCFSSRTVWYQRCAWVVLAVTLPSEECLVL